MIEKEQIDPFKIYFLIYFFVSIHITGERKRGALYPNVAVRLGKTGTDTKRCYKNN